MKQYIIGYWDDTTEKQERKVVNAKDFKEAQRKGKDTVKKLKSQGCKSRLMCVCELGELKKWV